MGVPSDHDSPAPRVRQDPGGPSTSKDTAITAKVKAAIFNEPSLKSSEINVETYKGRVQLSGFVSSQADIAKAASLAQSVTGVTSVRNDMRLK